MITLANVDLPAPFVPITTWISPLLIVKLMPFKISFSSIEARTLSTRSNSATYVTPYQISYYIQKKTR